MIQFSHRLVYTKPQVESAESAIPAASGFPAIVDFGGALV